MRLGLGLGLGTGSGVIPAPSTVPAVSAFWRADLGASAAAWANQLASGDFTQSTGGKRPTVVAGLFGPRPGVRFDGVAQGMNGPVGSTVITASEATIYVLATVRSITLNAANIYQSDTIITDASGDWGLGLRSSTGFAAYNYDGTVDETTATAVSLNTPHVFRWRHSGGKVYQRLDSGGETAGVNSGDTLGLSNALRLGYGYTGANFFAAIDVGAVVTANAAVSTTNDAAITRWLRWYGGI